MNLINVGVKERRVNPRRTSVRAGKVEEGSDLAGLREGEERRLNLKRTSARRKENEGIWPVSQKKRKNLGTLARCEKCSVDKSKDVSTSLKVRATNRRDVRPLESNLKEKRRGFSPLRSRMGKEEVDELDGG